MADARGMVKRKAGLKLWLSGGWLALVVLAALLAPWIAPQDPLAQDLFLGRMPPAWVSNLQIGSVSLGSAAGGPAACRSASVINRTRTLRRRPSGSRTPRVACSPPPGRISGR